MSFNNKKLNIYDSERMDNDESNSFLWYLGRAGPLGPKSVFKRNLTV
jgi:hypothetical protein